MRLLSFIYRFYDSVDVCKIREGWAEARVNGCFPAFAGPPAKVALVNVFSTTDVDFCLFQEGVRLVFLCACKHIALYGLMVWLHQSQSFTPLVFCCIRNLPHSSNIPAGIARP